MKLAGGVGRARFGLVGVVGVVGVVALLVAPARAEERVQTLLVLRAPAALGAEEERLVEALRIYTRDRDCRLVLEGEAPASLEGRGLVEIVARARSRGAELVVWTARRADGRAVYYVLTVAGNDLRETEIAPLGPERTAVDVALKVRALLGRGPDRAEASPPAPAAVERPLPAPPSAPPALVAAPPPAPEEPPPPPERLALGVGYGVFLPSDPAWVRQGLVVALEARVGRLAGAPLTLVADTAFTTRARRLVRGFDVSLADLPVGLAALVGARWGRAGAAVGPRLGLHVLDVTARADDGRAGTSRRVSTSLGGRLEVDLRLFTYMKVYLAATLEIMIPKEEFTIAGQSAVTTGHVLGGGSAGVALLIP